ncbi:uncharacterized protein [Venturia canescens]|nr:uncharacterized protein LOC122417332 isoform X2 [Venturia canescens]
MPGCTKVKLDVSRCSTSKWEKHKKTLSKWVTPDGYLNQEKFRQSMEGSISQGIQNNRKFEGFTLEVRKNGPAFTLWINNESGLNMSVDLVPVLEFFADPPLNGTFNGSPWYAVPKPHKVGNDTHLNWRMSFFMYEKKILLKHGQLKPVIRHVKKLRDTQNWKIIPSYHIETLFMHFSQEMESCPELAQLTGIKLFLQMLERLKNVCQQRNLLNFWDPSHNLIEAEEIQLAGIVGRLARIIKEIDSDPGKMTDWLLTSSELSSFQEELAAICDTTRDSDTSSRCSEKSGNGSTNGFKRSVFPVGDVSPNPNPSDDSRGNKQSNDTDDLSKLIISNFKLIRNDISRLQRSVDLLSNRLAIVENKLFDIHDKDRKVPSWGERPVFLDKSEIFDACSDSSLGLRLFN